MAVDWAVPKAQFVTSAADAPGAPVFVLFHHLHQRFDAIETAYGIGQLCSIFDILCCCLQRELRRALLHRTAPMTAMAAQARRTHQRVGMRTRLARSQLGRRRTRLQTWTRKGRS